MIFSSIFTAPVWQGRPWWGRALPSSGCPRSVSSWTVSRTCGKIGACAASCARRTGKEGDRWFYFSLCIWPRQIIVTDLILFCKSFIATLLCAFVVGAVLPRQVPPYKDQSWWIETSQYGTTIDQWSETQYQFQSWLIETYQYCTTLDRWWSTANWSQPKVSVLIDWDFQYGSTHYRSMIIHSKLIPKYLSAVRANMTGMSHMWQGYFGGSFLSFLSLS